MAIGRGWRGTVPEVVAVALLVWAVPACAGPDAAAPERPLVRDSAGIRIVENGRIGAEGAMRPRVREVFTLGAVDGPEETSWGRVVDVVALPDGGVAVADGLALVVRLFDSAGTHVRTVGGPGRGPSELQKIAGLARMADTVAVWDWRQRKLVLFDSTGRFVDTRPFPVDVFRVGFPDQITRMPGGDLLLTGRTGCRVPRRDGDHRWHLARVPAGGGPVEVLVSEERPDVIPVYGPPGTFCVEAPLLFPRRPLVAALPSGEVAWYDHGGGQVQIFDGAAALADPSAATPRRVVRRAGPAVPVTPRDLELHRVGVRAVDLSEPKVALILEALDAAPAPTERPLVDRMLSDGNGGLWLRRPPGPAETTAVWEIYDAGGIFQSLVELPASLTVHAIREGRVYGTQTDALDVDRVRVLEVGSAGRRGAGGGR